MLMCGWGRFPLGELGNAVNTPSEQVVRISVSVAQPFSEEKWGDEVKVRWWKPDPRDPPSPPPGAPGAPGSFPSSLFPVRFPHEIWHELCGLLGR